MHKYTVLIIEDDESTRNKLSTILTKEGFDTVQARDGEEGLEIFHEKMPEVVITDLSLPGVDGLEVMRQINRLSSKTQTILITAYGETDTVVSALREGALDYLKKPIDLERLHIALGRAREKIDHYNQIVSYPAVLLAEDHDATRTRLERVLTKEGWNVFTASNGDEAVEIFKARKIDIVVLDIKMPQKSGIETLHELRHLSADFEAIIVTGFGDESSAIQALRDGAINFLRKPIDLDQMILTLEKAFEKLKSDRSLKYRLREIELKEKIIAKITASKEIVIDIREKNLQSDARIFAQALLRSIPVNFIVLEKRTRIIYVSSVLSSTIGYEPETVDEALIANLDKIGLKTLGYDQLLSLIDEIDEGPVGEIKTLSIGKYSTVTVTSVTLLERDGGKRVLVVVFRGERPER